MSLTVSTIIEGWHFASKPLLEEVSAIRDAYPLRDRFLRNNTPDLRFIPRLAVRAIAETRKTINAACAEESYLVVILRIQGTNTFVTEADLQKFVEESGDLKNSELDPTDWEYQVYKSYRTEYQNVQKLAAHFGVTEAKIDIALLKCRMFLTPLLSDEMKRKTLTEKGLL